MTPTTALEADALDRLRARIGGQILISSDGDALREARRVCGTG